MATPTVADLKEQVAELEDQNEQLRDKLDAILDIAAEPEADEDDESDND